jgi:thioredoxin 1
MRRSVLLILVVVAAVVVVVIAKRGKQPPPISRASPVGPAVGSNAAAGRPVAAPYPDEDIPRAAPGRPAGEAHAARSTGEADPASVEGNGSAKPRPGSELAECLQNGLPTMADFGAGWCAACKKMEPVLAQSAARYEGRANIIFVDTEEYPALTRRYRVATIPTQIVFDVNGREVQRHVGYWPLEEIDKQLTALGAGL